MLTGLCLKILLKDALMLFIGVAIVQVRQTSTEGSAQ